MPGIYVSAAGKSSGKTTVCTGLCAALAQRGLAVQPFKKGPDYIDPMWLAAASGRPCYNLDFNTQGEDEILDLYHSRKPGPGQAQIRLVEGNKGLYDGVDVHGSDSNAAMAKLLGLPVLLVVDTQGITRGVAPLLNGYQSFDRDIEFAGVILNKIGGSRHEGKLRNVIEQYTDFRVLGAVHRNEEMVIPERHLGLVTDKEDPKALQHIGVLAKVIEDSVDVDQCLSAGRPSQETAELQQRVVDATKMSKQPGIRIAVARDSAFCFYYPDDLEAMQKAGAELRFFDTINDAVLPDADALLIGGGFPETHCRPLENNQAMKQAVAGFVQSGKPVYAECGGLMYLARRIRWQGVEYAMVGAIPADIEMTDRPVGRGYVRLKLTANHPWCGDSAIAATPGSGTELRAHEFHYSTVENLDSSLEFAYDVNRGHGINGSQDGIVMGNVFAGYAHLRHTRSVPWVDWFVGHVRRNSHGDGTR
jgi:cobyrinic acid a,c-diamide synthase